MTLTDEQVGADRDREPVSGQMDFGTYPVPESEDRALRKQDDRVVTRIAGQGAGHIAGVAGRSRMCGHRKRHVTEIGAGRASWVRRVQVAGRRN